MGHMLWALLFPTLPYAALAEIKVPADWTLAALKICPGWSLLYWEPGRVLGVTSEMLDPAEG